MDSIYTKKNIRRLGCVWILSTQRMLRRPQDVEDREILSDFDVHRECSGDRRVVSIERACAWNSLFFVARANLVMCRRTYSCMRKTQMWNSHMCSTSSSERADELLLHVFGWLVNETGIKFGKCSGAFWIASVFLAVKRGRGVDEMSRLWWNDGWVHGWVHGDLEENGDFL